MFVRGIIDNSSLHDGEYREQSPYRMSIVNILAGYRGRCSVAAVGMAVMHRTSATLEEESNDDVQCGLQSIQGSSLPRRVVRVVVALAVGCQCEQCHGANCFLLEEWEMQLRGRTCRNTVSAAADKPQSHKIEIMRKNLQEWRLSSWLVRCRWRCRCQRALVSAYRQKWCAPLRRRPLLQTTGPLITNAPLGGEEQ